MAGFESPLPVSEMAGFASTPVIEMAAFDRSAISFEYRLTVSRSTPTAFAIFRCDQPLNNNPSIAFISAILSLLAIWPPFGGLIAYFSKWRHLIRFFVAGFNRLLTLKAGFKNQGHFLVSVLI